MSLGPADAALSGKTLDEVGQRALSVLALNTDLPIFPGGGGVEFLTMKSLAARARVGLVSMAHTREDLERSRTLVDAGVRIYLWHSPGLDRAPAASRRRSFGRTAHGWVRRLAEAALARPDRPSDARVMDAAFGNMAPALIQALSDRSWHVLAVVQSHAAAMIDHVPRPLVSVLVMHDIRARLYERWADVSGSTAERWRLRREARRHRGAGRFRSGDAESRRLSSRYQRSETNPMARALRNRGGSPSYLLEPHMSARRSAERRLSAELKGSHRQI